MNNKIKICISLLLLTIILITLFAIQFSSNTKNSLKYYAHRGYMSEEPENTLPAFTSAMDAGFDGIEFDIFETSSGDIMVFHDETTERLCDLNESIFNISIENRNQYLIVKGENIEKYGSLVIPTFEETVKEMSEKGAFLFIHLKSPKSYTSEGITEIHNILKKYNMIDQSIIFCGKTTVLKKFQEKGLVVGKNMTTTTKDTATTIIQQCIENDFKTFIIFYPEKVTKELVETCHENGIQIGVYKVKTKKQANRLEKLGVDFIFTNYSLFE